EKWKVKQEQNKLSVLQISVEEERRMITDQLTRERSELQSSKDALLKEQKTIYSQLYDERRALSEERTQFNMLQSTLLNREQRDTVRNVQAEADLEGTMKTLSNEKMRLQTMSEELQKEQQRINTQKLALDQQKAALQMEKEKLDELATHMKLRSQEVEEISLEASKVREEGDRMLAEARKVQAEQSNKLQNIQIQISALREKERQIAQERLGLAKEKKELGQLRNSFICVNCRTPVKEATQHGSPILGAALNIPGSSANANGAAISFQGSGTGEPFTSPVLNSISSSLVKDRTFRMWKINAEKDHEFLEDESLFLEALKHSPYHTPPTAVKD
ncbi:fas-binding factor 1, partial [Lingula anatina]|uniref:Fas-binding factor 1 n=1 Tax=Lingula anatina TaxID=7574 RepID=A0A1S3J560_LINAN